MELRADNLLMRDGAALAIDWSHLHQGAAWIAPAFLVPQLIRAGHTAGRAEELIGRATSWSDAPPRAVTSFAVAQAGYWERNSRLPAPPGVPYLRDYQPAWRRSDGPGSPTGPGGADRPTETSRPCRPARP
ncbi:hypothetical protein OG618_20585 [Kitasatospora sp. NBC_01246]|uniref:hypothetical protein n=1 Tax=Kitasatospora sp. NBC_01246 TaxID=2903570 RepID=UPI002E30C79E|nr:hypothetical protein [Kitasatospora sp. NBC_01246]